MFRRLQLCSDDKLHGTVVSIHGRCIEHGRDPDGLIN